MLRRRQRAGVVAAEGPVAHAGDDAVAGVEQERRQHAQDAREECPTAAEPAQCGECRARTTQAALIGSAEPLQQEDGRERRGVLAIGRQRRARELALERRVAESGDRDRARPGTGPGRCTARTRRRREARRRRQGRSKNGSSTGRLYPPAANGPHRLFAVLTFLSRAPTDRDRCRSDSDPSRGPRAV